ncbi:hypothetical protein GWI33_008144 [Rhynchophorus ferrugineus]|uniref:Uncharacterized protein n=1 Tax=Rhynchophorus ferrugineus TaxID=354439 RepID=A0A834MHM3_RHYFE|nr:hypothetical protein GWI33_008144 [Rhynchophorus ferrugineus]
MPQRSPFAIQELLGLGDSQHHRSPTAAVSAITPNVYPHQKHYQLQTPAGFHPSEHGFAHHHMTMAASRMAYFNAQAAVAAAFLPHGIAAAAQMNAAAGGGPGSAAAVLGLAASHQSPASAAAITTEAHVKRAVWCGDVEDDGDDGSSSEGEQGGGQFPAAKPIQVPLNTFKCCRCLNGIRLEPSGYGSTTWFAPQRISAVQYADVQDEWNGLMNLDE